MLQYITTNRHIQNLYYLLKPLMPRKIQVYLRRLIIKKKRKRYLNVWPINEKFYTIPDTWCGWPEHKQFALVLTHDVEDIRGYRRVKKLVQIEKSMGFRSSFNFVPKRYTFTHDDISYLKNNGFEIGVHGLFHDGKLYKNFQLYLKRAAEINKYLKEWQAVGFRAPSMHHNMNWNCYLNIEYDLSTFDTDPFEPQPDGIGTIFPQKIENCKYRKNCPLECIGYIEMPYTLPQDFTVFILLEEKDINIWKQKVDWLAEKGGMVLLNTHPDYMNFGDDAPRVDEYSSDYYVRFLDYIRTVYGHRYWHVLPHEMAYYWRTNMDSQTSVE